MHFSDPLQFVWLIPFALYIAVKIWSLASARKLLTQLIDASLIEKIFPYQAWAKFSVRKAVLQIAGLGLVILALAGPEIGQKLQSIQTKGSNVFILFDCSSSMLAEDFKPNRMEKSKRILTGLLEKMHGNRVGIIAFAGNAYVYCPMTFDLSTARRFLKSIEAGMVPEPGTHIGDAIRLAAGRMPGEKDSNAIVLLTDGEDHKSDPAGAAEEAKKAGIRIFAIGIGNPQGEPIPERDGSGNVTGYHKNSKGEVVLSKLGEETLSKIATGTGGSYFRASESEQEIDVLADQLAQMEKNPMMQKRSLYENRFQWFLGAGLILLILGECLDFIPLKSARALAVFGLMILAALNSSDQVQAAGFNQKIREGNKLYKREKYEEAAQSYDQAREARPSDVRANFNKGAALYKLQDWDRAKEEFQRSAVGNDANLNARSLYNLGNSFFQQKNYKEAAEAYKQSLKLNPYDEDAKENLKLALRMVQVQPPQKQKSKDGDQKEKGNAGKDDDQEKERKENAQRILKGASQDPGDKPIFKPNPKGKDKKTSDEDW